jgi:hypothetical protein
MIFWVKFVTNEYFSFIDSIIPSHYIVPFKLNWIYLQVWYIRCYSRSIPLDSYT